MKKITLFLLFLLLYPIAATAQESSQLVPVQNTAALRQASTASYPYGVWRLTDGIAAAPPLFFLPGSSACPVDDGASCVDSSDGKSWIARFSPEGADVREWGAVGDGETNATTAVQAAINAVSAAGGTLLLGPYKYLISSGLTSSGIIDIEGVNGNHDVYQSACSSGFLTNSNINLLTLTGLHVIVRNVCFQMATSAGTRTGGTALTVGATARTQQGHSIIEGNTIINAYDGIENGGPTTGATQTNSNIIADNTVIDASNIGIANGRSSIGASTVGTVIRDNQIACFKANSAAVGIAIYDGAIFYYGANGGPYFCNVGFLIAPGGESGATQTVLGQFTGVLGDSSLTSDLMIMPSNSYGLAFYLQFDNVWASSIHTTDTPVLIETPYGGSVRNVTFTNLTAHSGPNQTTPIVDLEGGSNISIQSSTICADGGGTSALGIKVNTSSVNIQNNVIGNCNGTLATGIFLPTLGAGHGIWTITGNNLGEVTTPISYVPAGETAKIDDNMGVDNSCPYVASAPAISIPAAATCINLTGNTTVETITNSAWSNRSVRVIADSGLTLQSQGAYPGFCGANTTLSGGGLAMLFWDNAGGCWAHSP